MTRAGSTRRRHALPRRQWPSPEALVLLIGVLLTAAVLRLYAVGRAQDLFIDEVTYTDLAVSLASGDGVRLHGEPFHLHPPGLFLVLAAVVRVLGLPTDGLAALAFDLRWVPALFGSLTAAVVALLVQRATRSWALAACAGCLLALEPFLVRFDGRVLLEAQAMCFAALGLLGLTALASRRPDHAAGGLWGPVLVGQVLVASLLTKETYGAVAVLPVLVLLATGLVLPRRTSAVVLASTVATYLLYVVVLGLTGQLGEWVTAKTSGVSRLLGLTQETGFNSDSVGSATLTGRVVANLASFGTTYAVIGLGVLAALWLLVLLRRGADLPGLDRPVVVLVVVWSLCAQVYLAYAVTLGTIEEQMFYALVVTAVPVVFAAGHLALSPAGPRLPLGLGRLPRRAVPGLLVLLLVATVALDGAVWLRVHTQRDDAYARFLAWASTELPSGSRVAVTDETTQFVLDDTSVLRVESGAQARAFRAEYVLLVTELVEQGYSPVDDELAGIVRDGRLVFSAEGRTVGSLQLYEVAAAGP